MNRFPNWLFRAFVPLVALSLAALAQDASSNAERWAEGVREKLGEKEYAEAFELAELALEYHPDDAELLKLAFRSALDSGEKDAALWYGEMALEGWRALADPRAKTPPPAIAEIEGELAVLDPAERASPRHLGDYRQALFEAGRSASKRKLYVNAVDLLNRSRELGLVAADAELEKIYSSKNAVQALLASGVDVPLKPRRAKKSAESIAKEDARRREWENAYEVKGDNYTVRTNMGYEMAHSISQAMEQVNQFYRKVFKVRERGGNTARVTVSVYKSRAEFEENEKLEEDDDGVLAFFVPGQNRVAAYDLREHGYAIGELWSTLFHEASHQFTHLVSADLIPGWLNEGTASYFEGARLLPNGTVETNLVPEDRLTYLELYLRKGSPTLEDVVRYYQPGSYDGEYYPFGWGLVYFLLNYEDDSSKRVYAPVYQDYMAAYGTGGKHDPFERFVDYFVGKAKQPGVKTFADFEARWKQWILDLHALQYGDSSKADVLIERARKQARNGQPEAAVESYRWALRKRPGDVAAHMEMAEILAGRKEEDAALFGFRNALASARSAKSIDAAAVERATARITKLDDTLGKQLAAADAKLFAACEATANAYLEKEFPRAALRFVELARTACGGSAALSTLRDKLMSDSGADVRRWRRPVIDEGLTVWEAGPDWRRDGEQLFIKTAGVSFLGWNEPTPERFRVEVSFRSVDLEEGGFVALTFGDRGAGLQYFGVGGIGLAEVGRLRKKWETIEEIGLVPPDALARLELAIDVDPQRTVFSMNGRQVFERAYSPEDTPGRVGLVMQDGLGGFADFRVRY